MGKAIAIPYGCLDNGLSAAATILFHYLIQEGSDLRNWLEFCASENRNSLEKTKAQETLRQMERFPEPGWFPLNGKRVQDDMGAASHRQSRIFRELKSKGKIQTKRVGCPPKRWVRVCLENMDRTEWHPFWMGQKETKNKAKAK